MSAVLSECGTYRYWLEREVPINSVGMGCALGVIMINPSTADATLDDPTIRRVRGFAEQYGVARVCVANLFAYRSKDVRDLHDTADNGAGIDVVGPENDFYLNKLFEECKGSRVVAAFGAFSKIPDGHWDQLEKLDNLAIKHKATLWCWGRNKDGSPKHPLYLPKDAKLQNWRYKPYV